MINNYKIARFATLLLVFFAFLTQSAKAQLEPFAQASGFISGTNGWVAHGGTGTSPLFTQQISIVAGSLAYTGLSTPTGNKITTVAGNTEDINRPLTAAITNTAYYSAIINVPNTIGLNNTATGDYSLSLGGTAGVSVTALTARVFLRVGGAPNTFNIGILNNSGGIPAPSYVGTPTATDYPVGTTLFIVVKYDRTTPASGTASIWVNPATGLATEPTPNATNTTGTGASPASLASICIRQGGTVTIGTGTTEIDEIRGGTDWASVTPASAASAPTIAITQGATAIPTANSPAFAMGSVALSTNLDVTFTITNAGTAPLTLATPIAITGTGYSIFTQPTSPVANGAGNTTTFVVRFNSATAVTNALGTVTIANNAGADYVVNLSANATAPAAPTIAITQSATAIPTANSPAFAMGSVALSTNLDVTFTITNAGTAPLTLTTPIAITGTGFSILTQPTSPVANGAGNTTTFVVRFNSATAVTNALGTVTITNNANTSYVVNLSATATAAPTPSIAITQGATAISTANSPAFAMGSIVTGSNLDVTFTITNAGTAPLTLTTPITITGTGYSILTQPTSPVANGAGNTTTFVVRFNSATAVTNALGTVTITNNANTSYVVNLSATATAAPTPSIAITQGATAISTANSPAFAMGSIVTGSNLDVTFTITNAGTASLTLTTPIAITGTGYSILTQPISPVANGAGNTTTFVVRFNSATVVTGALGTVTITNNANTSYVVNLSANTTAPVVGGTDYEPFLQASGSAVSAGGWITHSGTAGQLVIATPTLVYSTLATPTGNKTAIVAGNSEDINKATSSPLTTDAYYSVLVNVQNTTALAINTANGEYFMNFGSVAGATTSSTGNALPARLFIRQGATAGTFNLGVLNNSGAPALPTFATTDYATSTTYFVVVKYVIATNTASLWINPATGLTTEPTTTITNNSGVTVTAPATLNTICIRQGGSLTPVAPATTPSSTGNIEIDEIRVGATWASVTPAGPVVVLPPSLTATPTTLSFGNVIVGATPAALSYSLSGANLTNPVTVTSPAAFQIATSATGTFGATLTFTVAQMATAQTIFVKPTSTATLVVLSGNITHASTGVTAAPSVAVSGTIINSSSIITAVLSVADFGVVNTGAVSTVKTFAVQGTNLTADLVVTAPTNFQVSKDGLTFGTSVTFTAVEVAPIDGKNVFVRFAPTSGVSGLKDVVITSASAGAVSKTTSVKGTESSPTTALDNSFAKEVVIYPNPAQTSFQIKLPTTSKNYVVEIVDISGKVILTKKSDEIISVENLQKGFYFVKFSNAERTFTKKISIN